VCQVCIYWGALVMNEFLSLSVRDMVIEEIGILLPVRGIEFAFKQPPTIDDYRLNHVSCYVQSIGHTKETTGVCIPLEHCFSECYITAEVSGAARRLLKCRNNKKVSGINGTNTRGRAWLDAVGDGTWKDDYTGVWA